MFVQSVFDDSYHSPLKETAIQSTSTAAIIELGGRDLVGVFIN